jgi:hypothetical protein
MHIGAMVCEDASMTSSMYFVEVEIRLTRWIGAVREKLSLYWRVLWRSKTYVVRLQVQRGHRHADRLTFDRETAAVRNGELGDWNAYAAKCQ